MGGARYRAHCLPRSREPFNRGAVYLSWHQGQTEGAGRVLVSRSLTLSPAPWTPWPTSKGLGGGVHLHYVSNV